MKSVAIRRFLSAGAAVLALTLAGCAAVQTTNSGAVGIQRQQYMSSLVSEQQLQQEAASQYSALISQARAQGALEDELGRGMLEGAAISGQKDRDFMAAVGERARQGSHRIRQSARLHVGEQFAGDVDDFHRPKVGQHLSSVQSQSSACAPRPPRTATSSSAKCSG